MRLSNYWDPIILTLYVWQGSLRGLVIDTRIGMLHGNSSRGSSNEWKLKENIIIILRAHVKRYVLNLEAINNKRGHYYTVIKGQLSRCSYV